MDNKITIHLGFYTKYSKDVLTHFISTYMYRQGGIATYTYLSAVCNVEQEADGEVVLKIDTNNWQYSRSSWRSRASNMVSMKQFFVGQFVKCIKKQLIPDIRYYNNELKSIEFDEVESRLWNINCHEYTLKSFAIDDNVYSNVTLSELKIMWYVMTGSKQFKKKISNELFNKIVGHARDPIQTEMEITRRNELCRLINERNDKNSELYRLEREEKRKMENEIENKYERLRKENSKEYDAKIAELEQMVNACLMSA
jgi:hypothetical protein